MIAAMDDSGEPGLELGAGSSEYFALTVVIFSNHEQASACQERMLRLKTELHLKERFEFKFTKCTHRQRLAFFDAVLPYDFRYLSRVIKKEHLRGKAAWKKREFFLLRALDLILEGARPHLLNAKLFFDECGGVELDRTIKRYLQKNAGKHEGVPRIKEAKALASHKHLLIQMADMFCGAVARSLHREDSDAGAYRQIIKKKELSVEVWSPKGK
jgi:hypothetical protein